MIKVEICQVHIIQTAVLFLICHLPLWDRGPGHKSRSPITRCQSSTHLIYWRNSVAMKNMCLYEISCTVCRVHSSGCVQKGSREKRW